jgi:hypothetical protein
MLLRASGKAVGEDLEIGVVTGREAGDGGVAHGEALVAFAEAVMGDDDAVLAKRRQALLKRIGPEGLVDVAAVIAGFNVVDRIADATGIPLDEGMDLATAKMRERIGINAFAPEKSR